MRELAGMVLRAYLLGAVCLVVVGLAQREPWPGNVAVALLWPLVVAADVVAGIVGWFKEGA